MKKILIATTNQGKLAEISGILKNFPVELVSLRDVGITDDVEETGATYEENSHLKALFYAKKSGLPAIADDGGIEISALGNKPGVKSRRWLGYDASDEELIEHMKKVSKELPEDNRKAWFRTVMSLALPDGQVWSVSGEVEGIIAKNPHMSLSKGYPYRSFFFLPEIGKYYHEVELTEKEQKVYNHRYKAIKELSSIINDVILEETK